MTGMMKLITMASTCSAVAAIQIILGTVKQGFLNIFGPRRRISPADFKKKCPGTKDCQAGDGITIHGVLQTKNSFGTMVAVCMCESANDENAFLAHPYVVKVMNREGRHTYKSTTNDPGFALQSRTNPDGTPSEAVAQFQKDLDRLTKVMTKIGANKRAHLAFPEWVHGSSVSDMSSENVKSWPPAEVKQFQKTFEWFFGYPIVGFPLTVARFAEHGDLHSFIGGFEENDVERIKHAKYLGLQVAEGLKVLHEAGFVHYDIKQDNVLVYARKDGGYIAKIIDFDFTTKLPDSQQTYLHPGQGSPQFVSPELVRDHMWKKQIKMNLSMYRKRTQACPKSNNEISPTTIENAPQTDVYSFGVMMYQLLLESYPKKTFTELIPISHNREGFCRNLDNSTEDIPKQIELHMTKDKNLKTVKQILKEILTWDPGARPTIAVVVEAKWGDLAQ